MKNWFKNFQAFMYPVTIFAVAIVYAFESFATRTYVDDKHKSVTETMEKDKKQVLEVLSEIKETLKVIDGRVYDMSGKPNRGGH